MKITVKRWIADQKYNEMKAFNRAPEFEYVNGYYADVENDTVAMTVLEVLKESEKAMQVKLETMTFDGCNYVEKKWTTWFPKSQIVKIA